MIKSLFLPFPSPKQIRSKTALLEIRTKNVIQINVHCIVYLHLFVVCGTRGISSRLSHRSCRVTVCRQCGLSGDRISRSNPEQTHWRSKRSIKQECIPVGCVPPAHWPYPRGVSSWGCLSRGGCLLGGVCPGGGLPGGCLPGGCAMWPIPQCIWCYLDAVLAPTETDHQYSCLYSIWSCDLWCMLGYTPLPGQNDRYM